MNFLKKCSLGLLVAMLLLMPIYSAATKQNKQKELEPLAMSVSLADRKPLIVPLPASGRKTAVLRASGHGISGVKIVGWMEDGLAKFEVSAILDDWQGVTLCNQLQKLRSELVGSYSARNGDTVSISDLKKNGLTSLQVTVQDAAPLLCPGGCCCCKGTSCCPNKENCIECSSCGSCCN